MTYPEAFRRKVLAHADAHGVASASAAFNVSTVSITNWRRQPLPKPKLHSFWTRERLAYEIAKRPGTDRVRLAAELGVSYHYFTCLLKSQGLSLPRARSLSAHAVALCEKVADYIRLNPAATRREIAAGVGGDYSYVCRILRQLGWKVCKRCADPTLRF